MSSTSSFGDNKTLLVLAVGLLLLIFFPSGKTFSAEQNPPLEVELENEVSLAPGEPTMISDHGSEITLSYETDFLEVETSSEFDLEGLSEAELLLGIAKDPIDTECEMTFDNRVSKLESYKLTGDIQLDPKTSLSLEYESDYPGERGADESELVFTLDRELTDNLSIEVEEEFSPAELQSNPAPSQTEIDLTGIGGQKFILDTEVEFEETELEQVELDFEGTDSFFRKTGLVLEGSVSWETSENFLEFEPEFEFEFANLYFETILHLRNKTRIGSLELEEAGLDDIVFTGWDLELSNDFESGETELTLEREKGDFEAQFELESRYGETDKLFNLYQFTGELDWEPEEFLTITVETEFTTTSLEELSLTTEYNF